DGASPRPRAAAAAAPAAGAVRPVEPPRGGAGAVALRPRLDGAAFHGDADPRGARLPVRRGRRLGGVAVLAAPGEAPGRGGALDGRGTRGTPRAGGEGRRAGAAGHQPAPPPAPGGL
ncbi:MAG: hypothetical protein AVDCRST_MAG04-77, partial [uncultured Acetobacteraceae bacterium]